MAESFYVIDGDAFVATERTRGPWSAEHQHGGPPAALVARALARLPADQPMHIARITVELLRPVPIATLRVEARWTKTGKRVRTSEATLAVGGDLVVRARALHVRLTDIDVPPPRAPWTPPPAPESLAPFVFPFFLWDVGYHTSVECRVTGGAFGSGHLAAWMRPIVPLLEGEAMAPLERVMTCVDSGNGLSVALDLARYTFVNPDLTVYLARDLAGEWVHLDAATHAEGHGVGLAQCALADARGPLGRSLQSLIIERR